jgi:hypothetical protein
VDAARQKEVFAYASSVLDGAVPLGELGSGGNGSVSGTAEGTAAGLSWAHVAALRRNPAGDLVIVAADSGKGYPLKDPSQFVGYLSNSSSSNESPTSELSSTSPPR